MVTASTTATPSIRKTGSAISSCLNLNNPAKHRSIEEQFNFCFRVIELFPNFGKRFFLPLVSVRTESPSAPITDYEKSVRKWRDEHGTKLQAYKLQAIADKQASLTLRVSLLDCLSREELTSTETKETFHRVIDELLVAASRQIELLLAPDYDTAWRYQYSGIDRPARIQDETGKSATTFTKLPTMKNYAVLLAALERIPSEERPRAGLDAVIQATQELHDRVRAELMELLKSMNYHKQAL